MQISTSSQRTTFSNPKRRSTTTISTDESSFIQIPSNEVESTHSQENENPNEKIALSALKRLSDSSSFEQSVHQNGNNHKEDNVNPWEERENQYSIKQKPLFSNVLVGMSNKIDSFSKKTEQPYQTEQIKQKKQNNIALQQPFTNQGLVLELKQLQNDLASPSKKNIDFVPYRCLSKKNQIENLQRQLLSQSNSNKSVDWYTNKNDIGQTRYANEMNQLDYYKSIEQEDLNIFRNRNQPQNRSRSYKRSNENPKIIEVCHNLNELLLSHNHNPHHHLGSAENLFTQMTKKSEPLKLKIKEENDENDENFYSKRGSQEISNHISCLTPNARIPLHGEFLRSRGESVNEHQNMLIDVSRYKKQIVIRVADTERTDKGLFSNKNYQKTPSLSHVDSKKSIQKKAISVTPKSQSSSQGGAHHESIGIYYLQDKVSTQGDSQIEQVSFKQNNNQKRASTFILEGSPLQHQYSKGGKQGLPPMAYCNFEKKTTNGDLNAVSVNSCRINESIQSVSQQSDKNSNKASSKKLEDTRRQNNFVQNSIELQDNKENFDNNGCDSNRTYLPSNQTNDINNKTQQQILKCKSNNSVDRVIQPHNQSIALQSQSTSSNLSQSPYRNHNKSHAIRDNTPKFNDEIQTNQTTQMHRPPLPINGQQYPYNYLLTTTNQQASLPPTQASSSSSQPQAQQQQQQQQQQQSENFHIPSKQQLFLQQTFYTKPVLSNLVQNLALNVTASLAASAQALFPSPFQCNMQHSPLIDVCSQATKFNQNRANSLFSNNTGNEESRNHNENINNNPNKTKTGTKNDGSSKNLLNTQVSSSHQQQQQPQVVNSSIQAEWKVNKLPKLFKNHNRTLIKKASNKSEDMPSGLSVQHLKHNSNQSCSTIS